MIPADFDAFAALMDDAAELLGKPALGERQMGLYFAALAEYALSVVRAAALAHMRDPQRGRFMPTPADLIAQIQAAGERDGRPGAEEAWALCLRGQDEAATIVWTAEMSEAWGVARVVMPDEVGARMTFKEAYQRLVGQARARDVAPSWTVSLGHDPERRAVAISEAVDAGRLPVGELLALPRSRPKEAVALLMLEHSTEAPDEAKAALRRLREQLASRADDESADAAERSRTQQLKVQAAARVAAYPGASA